jgi:iron-sulfur cluster assembly protein
MATVERSEDRIDDTAVIALTERAAEKILSLMAEEPAGEATVLRVAVQGGGCSGFEYALGFDRTALEGDLEAQSHGVDVVVDPFSAPYLKGASIDYLETIQESGFKIENPNVSSACGCGHSFQVAEGEELPEGTSAGGCGSGCSA